MAAIIVRLQKFQKFYERALETSPIITKCITAGVMFMGGDIICQAIEHKSEKWDDWKLDVKRVMRMTAFGFCVLGPAGHYWYKFLDKQFPKTTLSSVLTKVALDQLVFSPPFYATFFMTMPLLEGGTPKEGIENVKHKFYPTYVVDCVVWPPAQTINFKLVPSQHRVLFVSAVSIGWNAFLSRMQHEH